MVFIRENKTKYLSVKLNNFVFKPILSFSSNVTIDVNIH